MSHALCCGNIKCFVLKEMGLGGGLALAGFIQDSLTESKMCAFEVCIESEGLEGICLGAEGLTLLHATPKHTN